MAQAQTRSDSALTPQVALPGPTDRQGGDRPEGKTRGAVPGLLHLSNVGIRQGRTKVGRDVLCLKSWAYSPAALEAEQKKLELRTFLPGPGQPRASQGLRTPTSVLGRGDHHHSGTKTQNRTSFVEDP